MPVVTPGGPVMDQVTDWLATPPTVTLNCWLCPAGMLRFVGLTVIEVMPETIWSCTDPKIVGVVTLLAEIVIDTPGGTMAGAV